MICLLLVGCIFQLFNQRTTYLATEYLIDHPRVVGLSLNPPRVEPGVEYELEALLAAPRGMEAESWTLKTCGLGREVPTSIGDLNCFNDPDEVTVLAEGATLPLGWTPPPLPQVECAWEPADTAAWLDSGGPWDPWCPHYLPLVLEGRVEGEPVFAAGWVLWYVEESDKEMPLSMRDARTRLELPDQGRGGETVELTLWVEGDHREGNFFWYVDGGELLDTGWTSAHGFEEASAQWPTGRTKTTNRWVLPERTEGDLRVMVTAVPQRADYGVDMTWARGRLEVSR